jgi:antirestriction protein ArdC
MAEGLRFSRGSGPCSIIRASALWPLCRYRHNRHWTRHPSHLAREFGRKRWGGEGYAAEELVAELGAAFRCIRLATATSVEPIPV